MKICGETLYKFTILAYNEDGVNCFRRLGCVEITLSAFDENDAIKKSSKIVPREKYCVNKVEETQYSSYFMEEL